MQRSSSSSSRSCDEQRTITIGTEQQQNAKRRRNLDDDMLDSLPLYNLRNAAGRRDLSRPRSSPAAEKWIHAIPILVLLCLFTLWWFSFQEDVEIKDGRITTIRQIPISNDTRFDITILAVAALSPIPSIHQDMSNEDEVYLAPASLPN